MAVHLTREFPDADAAVGGYSRTAWDGFFAVVDAVAGTRTTWRRRTIVPGASDIVADFVTIARHEGFIIEATDVPTLLPFLLNVAARAASAGPCKEAEIATVLAREVLDLQDPRADFLIISFSS